MRLLTNHRVAFDAPREGRRSRMSFVLPRLLMVMLAALIALPIAEAAHPVAAGKKNKSRTITRTFSSDGQIDIPATGTTGAANPYPVTINIDAFKKFKKAKVTDVNLTLKGFEHDQSTNIDVMLVHGDRRALVMSDTGNTTDVSDLTITLDDEAGGELPVGLALASGRFRPTNLGGTDNLPAPAPAPNGNVALASFDGSKPDGQWQLFIYDDASGQTGRLTGGWELEITAKVKKAKKNKK